MYPNHFDPNFSWDYNARLHLHFHVAHMVEHVDSNQGNKVVIIGIIVQKCSRRAGSSSVSYVLTK